MKILYDITFLGRGHVRPFERAGIFRVIESVAEELINNSACQVTLCANSNWNDIGLAKDYLLNNPILGHLPFSEPENYQKTDELMKQRSALIKGNGGYQNLPFVQKNIVRLKIKGLQIRQKIAGGFQKHLLNPADLKNADVYHSHFFANFNGLKEAGVKSVFVTSYDIIPILFPKFCRDEMPQQMESVISKLTPEAWVLCISEATRNDLLNYMGNRLDPAKVKVTPLAASSRFYQSADKPGNKIVRNKYGIPDTPYALSLCTLEPRKNIDQAIRAFVRLVQQQPDVDLNLVLVGAKGWKFENIFNTIEASDAIKSRIYITGYMADEDLAAVYSDALMFVYPTFYEGFGLPPLEAMQCGLPVITSNTSSLPEVVGDAGIMIDPTDTDALCQAMWSIYNQPVLQSQLSEKGLNRAKQFSWKRCVDETVAAYKASL